MESLLIYILKSAGLISVFYLLYILLLKNDTSFTANRKFLLAGIFTSLVLPAIYFTKKVLVAAPEIFYNSSSNPNFTAISETTTQGLDWWMVAGTIYLIISGFFLLRFCFRIFQILVMIHFSQIRKEGKFKTIKTQDTFGPFSFFNYIFINPKNVKEQELQLMLTHEKVHARQFHSVDMLLSNLITAVLWFNPISWYYKKSVEQNLEFIADNETAEASGCIQEYQHVLVKVSTNQYQNVLVNHFYQSFIKKRILMLNNKNTSPRNAWKHQLILPLLAVFLMSFNVKTTTKFIKNNPSKITEPIVQKESLSATIVKTATNESLEKFKSIFLKWDVELDFDNIEYSVNSNIITAIEVKFKNINTRETGVLIKNDPNGIAPFQIYVNKNGNTGFRDISPEEHAQKTAALQLNEIGKNPLYIVNKKDYSTLDLNGKTISTKDIISIIKPIDAYKRFGSKASDGAIIITDGKIIDDFEEELKSIDKENKLESRHFIEIQNNEPPVFISLSHNPKSKNSSSKNNISKSDAIDLNVQFISENSDTINDIGQIRNVKTKNGNRITWTSSDKDSIHNKNIIIKRDSLLINNPNASKNIKLNSGHKNNKPLYVVNGEIEEDDNKVLSINPDNIQNVFVIKDESAIKKYGIKGKDGVVEINTKNNNLFRITANMTDSELENLKGLVASTTSFKLSLNGIERNKKGLISNISVKFKDNSRKMVSGNYSESDGIFGIYVGQKEDGGLIIYSN